ncbi:glycoside hydrolase family 15 protein [Aquipuribacter nitratireducens]|uniref:Glycoside hydrolase family 15 protein n=1 Tax=Aquipuribacter nitratireducens TaxID=650104 RepID=A0ABW0GIU4_9MICO
MGPTLPSGSLPQPIGSYALLGDLHCAALVSEEGSVDWLCLPRFDSPACFAALLGTPDDGRWLLRPADDDAELLERGYRADTLTLETVWRTGTGTVRVTETMPVGGRRADLVRRVEGVEGTVRMRQELVLRFGYGADIPWVRRIRDDGSAVDAAFALPAPRQTRLRGVGSGPNAATSASDDGGAQALLAVAGPDAVLLRCDPLPVPVDHRHAGEFDVAAGRRHDLVLTWYPSHRPPPEPVYVTAAIDRTDAWWKDWASRCAHEGRYSGPVKRSLLTLRALTHEDTGGIVAAATTSLPEDIGGERNWDYRYVWLRDAALTLEALLAHGYLDIADSWRQWLLRAVAGAPEDVQIMYGIAGERRLEEYELDHLAGYAGSRPVRVGNAAVAQLQVDVIGEVMVALHAARCAGLPTDVFSWSLQAALLDHLAEIWDRYDNGIWEIRGELRAFTHSRIMAWAAFDRGVRAVEDFGRPGHVEVWQRTADEIREQVLRDGVDPERGNLVQYLGGTTVDAALLQAAQVGFLDWDDPVMLATVQAVESDLVRDGLVLRYRAETGVDGLAGDEHPFLACSFWLVEHWARTGREKEATSLMDRLVSLSTPGLGLLAEEYDPAAGIFTGNYPQAFSHLALVRAAEALDHVDQRDEW